MPHDQHKIWEKAKRPAILIPTLAGLLVAGGTFCYLALLSPGSILVRWAQAALPDQITKISFGPYPQEKDLRRLKREGVKYIVSTLDPRLPYEQTLLEREKRLGEKYGLNVKDFPMASIFDRKIFPDYFHEQERAVNFLKQIDAPAYVHCYLGKHRVIHVRDALLKAGIPRRYVTPASSSGEYWELISRIDEAQAEFNRSDFARVLEILEPVKTNDVDVTYLRGWARYRLDLIEEAMKAFRQGLEIEPNNPRNLEGLGYCYLRNGQAVMAQRQFNAVLEQMPDEASALIGLGLSYLQLGRKPAAADSFNKVLAADASNEEARRYLREALGR